MSARGVAVVGEVGEPDRRAVSDTVVGEATADPVRCPAVLEDIFLDFKFGGSTKRLLFYFCLIFFCAFTPVRHQ